MHACQILFRIAVNHIAKHKKCSDRTEMTDYDKGKIDTYHNMKLKSTEISEKID